MFVKRGATEISMLSRMYIKGFINTFLTCKEVLYGWGEGASRFSLIITIFTKMVGFCQGNELCETIYMYIDNCHTRGTIKNKYKFV